MRPGCACVRCGLPQGECDDKRKQALNRRREPLDHAQITAADSGRDEEVSLATFEEAWSASDNFAVVTT